MTTNEMIASIKQRGMIPTSQKTVQNEDFIRYLNEEMNSFLLPKIMKTREDYLVQLKDVPIVANQEDYDLPSDAIGNKLRDVTYNNAPNIYPIYRIEYNNIAQYNFPTGLMVIRAFYMRGNKMVLIPAPNASIGFLRMSYYRKPNTLVLESRCAKITNIVGNVISVASVPTNITSSSIVDLVSNADPNPILGDNLSILNLAGTDFTFDSIPSGLAIGDWICLNNEAPVLTLVPDVTLPVLIQKCVVRILNSMGFLENANLAAKDLTEMLNELYTLIEDRVEGRPHKLVNINSPLQQGLRRYRRWY